MKLIPLLFLSALIPLNLQALPSLASQKSKLFAAAEEGKLIPFKQALYHMNSRVSLTTRDYAGRIGLHYAAKLGHVEIVEFYSPFKEILATTCEEGNTALHEAARYGQILVVKTLLEGKDSLRLLNIKNKLGQTALAYLQKDMKHLREQDPLFTDESHEKLLEDQEVVELYLLQTVERHKAKPLFQEIRALRLPQQIQATPEENAPQEGKKAKSLRKPKTAKAPPRDEQKKKKKVKIGCCVVS